MKPLNLAHALLGPRLRLYHTASGPGRAGQPQTNFIYYCYYSYSAAAGSTPDTEGVSRLSTAAAKDLLLPTPLPM